MYNPKQTICDIRSETEWGKIWEEAVSMAEKHDVSYASHHSRPRRQQKLPQRYDDSIVHETTGRENIIQIIDEYRIHIYYSTLDIVLEELNWRFTEVN